MPQNLPMTSDLPRQRIGVVDIGSNSVRLVIFDVAGAAFIPIYNEKVLAGLGRDLAETNRLHPGGIDAALKALHRFTALARSLGLPPLLIAATAALRDADDAPDFIAAARAQCGLEITPISGEQEAHISALGLLAMEPRAKGIAADLGGASLELMRVGAGRVGAKQSYRLGPFSVSGEARKDPADSHDGGFDAAHLQARIEKVFAADGVSVETGDADTLYLIGGAWRNLALVHQARTDYPLRMAQNYSMSVPEALQLANWAYSDAGREELLGWRGISNRRLETLPYAGLMLEDLIARLFPQRVVFAAAGLREGLIAQSLGSALHDREPLFDACRAFRSAPMTGFGRALSDFIAPVAHLIPSHFAPEAEARLRFAACLMSGSGAAKHPDHRAALVFEDVLYAPLPGLTHTERAYMAQIVFASFTGAAQTRNEAAMCRFLTPEARTAARSYGLAIRLGAVVSARSPEILRQFQLTDNHGDVQLSVDRKNESLLTEVAQMRLGKFGAMAGLNTGVMGV